MEETGQTITRIWSNNQIGQRRKNVEVGRSLTIRVPTIVVRLEKE